MVRGVYEFMAREMILKNPNSGEFYESSKNRMCATFNT